MHACTHIHTIMQTHIHKHQCPHTCTYACMLLCVYTQAHTKKRKWKRRERLTWRQKTYYQMEKLIYWQPKTDRYRDRDEKTALRPAKRQTSSFLQRWMFMGFSSSSSKALHRVRSLSSSRWMWYTSRLQQSHKRLSTAPTRLIIMGFWTLYYVTHTDQIHLVNSTTDPLL